jgi:hypothetical protein
MAIASRLTMDEVRGGRLKKKKKMRKEGFNRLVSCTAPSSFFVHAALDLRRVLGASEPTTLRC